MNNLKQMGKRSLSLVLASLMCLTLLPMNVFAAQVEEAGHTHNQDGWVCEETQVFVCGQEHTHDDKCYNEMETLVLTCEQEETEDHTHGEDCYTAQRTLICEMEEHVNTEECETATEWGCTAPSAAVTAFLQAVKLMSQQENSEESVSAARNAYERLDETEKANKDVAAACELLKGAEEALESGEEDEEQSILDQVLDAITGGTLAEVDGRTITLTVGESHSLSGTSSSWNHKWESSDKKVATVSGSEKSAAVSAVGEGTATITHTYGLLGRTETWTIKVEVPTPKAVVTVTLPEGSPEGQYTVTINGESVQVTGGSSLSAEFEGELKEGDGVSVARADGRSLSGTITGSELTFTADLSKQTWPAKKVTLTYKAGTGGNVSSTSEEVEENSYAVGSTATPDKDYHFKNWTNSKGEEVSTSKTFVPPQPDNGYKNETYTANFYRLTPQTAYFYILKPGYSTAQGSADETYREAWYYVGTGTVLGTDPKDGNSGGVASVVSYPSINRTIPLDGVDYVYFDGIGTPPEDGNYYTVSWSMPTQTSYGANDGGDILTTERSWHVDGFAVFNTKKESTVNFMLKDAGKENFAVDPVNSQNAIIVEHGKSPTAAPSHGSKVVGGVTYNFDGWYLDPECTQPVNPTSHVIQGPTTFYGRYLPGTVVPYTITYSGLEGATVTPANPTSYTVNDTFTLNNPTKPGYTFLGWTGTGLSEASKSVTVSNGTGNRSYTATWEARTDLSYVVKYLDEDGNALVQQKTVENKTFGETVTENAISVNGYELVAGEASSKSITVSATESENVITFTYTKRTDLSYTVNYLEKDTNVVLKQADTVNGQNFGAEVDVNAAVIPGYNVEGSGTQKITIAVSGNEVTFYYTKRTDLGYTVNYLEKDTNVVLKQADTVNGQNFGAEVDVNAAVIPGYNVEGSGTQKITIAVSGNEVTFYYTKRTDLSYTARYVDEAGNELHAPAMVGNQTFQATVTVDPIDIDGYVKPASQEITIGTGSNEVTFTYTKRTDLSYTVNYLDEDTGAAIHDPKTVDGQTFEDVVRAADEVAAIDGYTYTRCDPAELTIAVENNVINLYYSVDRMGENGQPDGIPDKYQIVVTYDVTNGSASFTSRVLTKRVGGTGAPSADGFAVLTADAIPSFRSWGDNYGNGGWLSAGAVVGTQLTSDTTYRYGFAYLPTDPGGTDIEDPEVPLGGDPDVEIDDPEVPLASASGLNDTEHFAYILGYDDDTVRPLDNITRAEVATIYFRLMTDIFRTINWSTVNDYSDVNEGDWHNNAISTCTSAEIVFGYEDGTFRPDQYITRAEFAAWAASLLDGEEYTGETVEDFTDTVGHWASLAIRRAVEGGWIEGEGDLFRPDEYITRAEAITIFNKMLHRVPDEAHMLSTMKTWVDNPAGTWYYEAVQEASNEHEYERDDQEIESWTELLEIRDWKKLEEQWAEENAEPDDNTDAEA